MLSKVLNHKLFEIFFEKLLIALVILLVGHLTNQSIERYKLAEGQRMAGAAAFVEACQKVWGKIYEYEAIANRQDDFDFRYKIASIYNSEAKKKLSKELDGHNKMVDQKYKEAINIINEKRFVTNEKITMHFFRYVALVKARASMLEKFNNEATITQGTIDALDKQIAAMRFSDDMAREYAISQISN